MSTTTTPQPLAPAPEPAATLAERLALFAADIKLSHTIFAMPFALLAMFLAAREVHPGHRPASGLPLIGQVLLIVLCMVFARTFAMGMNRLLDARLDAANPRTARRAIPSGKLSPRFVTLMIAACGLAFALTTVGFGALYANWLPLAFALPVLAFVGAYPLLKRFTDLCHYYLGAALGLAPFAAWVAIAGSFAWTPVLLGLAVLCWTAGFDVIYACQDYDSDRATGTFSVPARLGVGRALWVARATHAACVALLIAVGLVNPQLHALWYVGVAVAVALLVYEHSLVSPNDLSKVNLAFFTLNGIISICLGVLGILDTVV